MTGHLETEPAATMAGAETGRILTERQPAARSAAAAQDQHPVDIRLSIPLLFGRYYVTVLAGRERRRPARRVEERRKRPLAKLGNVLFMLCLGILIGLALYGLQMTLGLWVLERTVIAH